MPNLRERSNDPELMDTVTFEDPEVRRTLAFLGLTARRFGGAAIIERAFDAWSPAWPTDREISVLDVGSGGAEIPIALAKWARRRRRRLRIVALDLVPEIAAVARENVRRWPEVDVRCANVFDLDKSGAIFDYVTASLFLHHVATPRIDDVLRLFDRLARRGMMVSDLERTAFSYWSVTALSRLAGNRVVRHDGPLSVRRAFTVSELTSFAFSAGLGYLRVKREPWFRLSLSGEKT